MSWPRLGSRPSADTGRGGGSSIGSKENDKLALSAAACEQLLLLMLCSCIAPSTRRWSYPQPNPVWMSESPTAQKHGKPAGPATWPKQPQVPLINDMETCLTWDMAGGVLPHAWPGCAVRGGLPAGHT